MFMEISVVLGMGDEGVELCHGVRKLMKLTMRAVSEYGKEQGNGSDNYFSYMPP